MKSDFRFQKVFFKKGCLKNRADENEIFFLFLYFSFFEKSVIEIVEYPIERKSRMTEWVKINPLIIHTVNNLQGQILNPMGEAASRNARLTQVTTTWILYRVMRSNRRKGRGETLVSPILI